MLVLFYSMPFYCTYRIRSIPFCAILLCYDLFFYALLGSLLFYSTLFCSIYSILCNSALCSVRFFIPLHFTEGGEAFHQFSNCFYCKPSFSMALRFSHELHTSNFCYRIPTSLSKINP